MPELTLTIRCSDRPQRAAEAWFIPGGDPGLWLREIFAWQIPQAGLRLYVVPRSRADLRPLGVLVKVGRIAPAATGRCQAFGLAAGRLYVPVEAVFVPPVDARELGDLLTLDGDYVFHPEAGLIRFADSETRSVADLISASPSSPGEWNRADPGVVFVHRLESLKAVAPPPLELVLEDGRDNIAEASPSEIAGGSGWKQRLSDLAERTMGRRPGGLRSADKELARLLDLLERDPDQGLRYAVPLQGGGAHRGWADSPGGLFERDVDFSLTRLGGGGAGTAWLTSDETYRELQRRYRELAERESQLGRHRRAAYIYGELLYDLNAAAAALCEGRYWREAAVLLRDRLNRPLEAAGCLAKGGLWTEAIELYEELGRFEEAGNLYTQIERPEDAARLYRRAAVACQAASDYVGAARLYDDRLNSPDDALEALSEGWPESAQRAECLRGIFALLARLERHQEASARIGSLRPRDHTHREIVVCEVLGDVVRTYPEPQTVQLAADLARVKCGCLLPEADQAVRSRVLRVLERLAPEDRLLSRDCQRYPLQRRFRPRPNQPKPVPRPSDKHRIVRQFQLLTGIQWTAAISSGDVVFVAGHGANILAFCRFPWDGAVQPAVGSPWVLRPLERQLPLLLAAGSNGDDRLLVALPGGRHPPQPQSFLVTDRLPGQQVEPFLADLPDGRLIGLQRDSRRQTWMCWLDARGRLTLNCTDGEGRLQSSRAIQYDADGLPSQAVVPMHVREDRICLALGHDLLMVRKDGEFDAVSHSLAIWRLAGSAPHTVPRLAVSMARGGEVVWLDGRGRRETFGENLAVPLIAFLRSGVLAAADDHHCECYTTRDGHVKALASFAHGQTEPIALIASNHPSEFGLITAEGNVTLYEVR